MLTTTETMHTKAMFDHLERMQSRVMAKDSMVTWKQFTAEPYAERKRYYEWMRQQCGELCDLI